MESVVATVVSLTRAAPAAAPVPTPVQSSAVINKTVSEEKSTELTVDVEAAGQVDAEKAQKLFQEALDSNYGGRLTFSHEGTGEGLHFKITDRETGRVIREFPSKEAPKLQAEIATGGLLVNGLF